MNGEKISTVTSPSPPLGNTRPQIDPDLLSSVRTLPAKTPLEKQLSERGVRIPLRQLFKRSFILGDDQMDRLREFETITLKSVELTGIQDHSTRRNSMDTVFVFRVFPESLIGPIKEKSDPSGHIQKDALRPLSLFEAIMVTWEDSSSYRPSYYDSVRSGLQTTAPLKCKEVDGEDRLFIEDFMPILSGQQIDDHYVRLDDEATGLLQDGEVLRVEEVELADRRSWTGSDDNRELALIFRMMPDRTRQSLFHRGGGPIRWVDRQPSQPLNAVFSISESQCPSPLLDLQKGQKVEATIELTEIDGAGRIVVRNAEALQKTQSSGSFSKSAGSEKNEGSPNLPRPRPSTNPRTSSPQYNDEWYEIDGHHIHRDQL